MDQTYIVHRSAFPVDARANGSSDDGLCMVHAPRARLSIRPECLIRTSGTQRRRPLIPGGMMGNGHSNLVVVGSRPASNKTHSALCFSIIVLFLPRPSFRLSASGSHSFSSVSRRWFCPLVVSRASSSLHAASPRPTCILALSSSAMIPRSNSSNLSRIPFNLPYVHPPLSVSDSQLRYSTVPSQRHLGFLSHLRKLLDPPCLGVLSLSPSSLGCLCAQG